MSPVKTHDINPVYGTQLPALSAPEQVVTATGTRGWKEILGKCCFMVSFRPARAAYWEPVFTCKTNKHKMVKMLSFLFTKVKTFLKNYSSKKNHLSEFVFCFCSTGDETQGQFL